MARSTTTRSGSLGRALWLAVIFVLTLGVQAANALEISLAPQADQSCNGAFQGSPDGSLAKSATRDGAPLPDGSTIEPGEHITFTFTWDTAEWQGETLDKLLDCFTVNGEAYDALEASYKPTANDGVETHSIIVPFLGEGDVLCDRARLSGKPAPDNPSTQKSNKLCFTVEQKPIGQEVEPGRISIEKRTFPAGVEQKFSFVGAIVAQLGDGETAAQQVAPGVYHVTEEEHDGWMLTNIVCDDDDSFAILEDRTATFRVDPGEHVHCVYYNDVDSAGSGELPDPGPAGGGDPAPKPGPSVKGGGPLPKTGVQLPVLLASALLLGSGGAVFRVLGRTRTHEGA